MLKKIIVFSIICYIIFNLLSNNCIGHYNDIQSDDYTKGESALAYSNIEAVYLIQDKADYKQDSMQNDKYLEDELGDAYKQLLEQKYEDFQLIPIGTKINKIIVDEGDVLIDFSSEMLNYGGITWEEAILEQLLGIAFSYNEVNSITFKIDNNTKNFVEGSIVNGYTRRNWNERNCFYNEGNTKD